MFIQSACWWCSSRATRGCGVTLVWWQAARGSAESMVRICFSPRPGGGCCASARVDGGPAPVLNVQTIAEQLSGCKVTELRGRAEKAGASAAELAAAFGEPEETKRQAYVDLIIKCELAPEPEPEPEQEQEQEQEQELDLQQQTSVGKSRTPTLPPRNISADAAPRPLASEHDHAAGATAVPGHATAAPADAAGGRDIALWVEQGSLGSKAPYKLKLNGVQSVEDIHAALRSRFELAAGTKLQVHFRFEVAGAKPEYRSLDPDSLSYLPPKAKVTVDVAQPAAGGAAAGAITLVGQTEEARQKADAKAAAAGAITQVGQTEEARQKADAKAREQMANLKADKQVEPGTPIRPLLYPQGLYVSCQKRRGRSNLHAIDCGDEVGVVKVEFDSTTTSWRVENGVIVCEDK